MHLTVLLYISSVDWYALLRIQYQFMHRCALDTGILHYVLLDSSFLFQANLAVENYDDVLADAEKALELGVWCLWRTMH
jgi:hypothetical protein